MRALGPAAGLDADAVETLASGLCPADVGTRTTALSATLLRLAAGRGGARARAAPPGARATARPRWRTCGAWARRPGPRSPRASPSRRDTSPHAWPLGRRRVADPSPPSAAAGSSLSGEPSTSTAPLAGAGEVEVTAWAKALGMSVPRCQAIRYG